VAGYLAAMGYPETAAALRGVGVDAVCLAGLLRIAAGAGGAGKLFDVLGDIGVACGGDAGGAGAVLRVRMVEELSRLLQRQAAAAAAAEQAS
jgi:hypothetical protein